MAARNSGGSKPSGGRVLQGADWDLCTTLEKTGMCARAGCNWRHENAEWWEGAWWALDDEGRSWGWWQTLPTTEECPVSLTPICMLPSAPFELKDSGGGAGRTVRHRFDSAALAKYVVGSGQFMNPVNRRPLTRAECTRLDKATNGMYGVAEAFAAVAEAGGNQRSRAAREVAVAARQLFVVPSAASAPGEPAQSQPQQAGGCSMAQAGRQEPRVPIGLQDNLTVHSEGALRVIDDSVGEFDGQNDHQILTAQGHAPTPAEALAAAAAGKNRGKYAPRPARAPPPPTNVASGGGGSSSSRRKAADVDDDVEKPAFAPRTAVVEEEQPKACIASASGEAWMPEWATPQLQVSQLDELTALIEQRALHLVVEGNEDPLKSLREAKARDRVVFQDGPVLCEVLARDVVVQIAVPPFYPTNPPTIVEARGKKGCTVPTAALRALERELRQELKRLKEATEPRALSALLQWIREHAVQRLEALCEQAAADRQAASDRQAAAQDGGGAAQNRSAARAVRAEVPPVRDEFKVERNAEKYSPGWDLCTAFVKHGKCKNKNCKWRHEKPAPVCAPAADPKPAQQAASGKVNGKKK